MFTKYLALLKKSDWALSLIAIFLVVFGLIAIYSIEAAAESPDYLNFKKQLIFFGVGLVALVFFSLLDYRYLRTYGWVLYVAGGLMLLAVLLFGTTIRGTRGWFILFGDLGFQPVEAVKIIMIIILSKFFYDRRAELASIKQVALAFGVAGLIILLVFLQPDFGSAFIMSAIFLGMLLIVKMKRSYLLGIGLILLVVIVGSWLFVLQDYQKERVATFLDPGRDPYGSGYNIKQSIIAVGSGNLFGRGLSLGPQSRLDLLPVQETDFIFAVIAEELGFVGSSLVLLVITLFIYRLIRIARKASDDFGLFLLSGVIIYFASQSILNIGMNIGILPIAGVPLPLVSYGGSSLIASLIAIGVVQSVKIHQATT